ncbi:alpha/beta hydrolase [Microbulbifer magnicolonia]|uniref:alpha/beta fold hydrolase n=1 Tax=Microbulbifer magnicolonia TaxID=3109744 RepID=UPI002B40CC67|nr:alpha/beta hydrolase [Microbulbifer sp. GG15]
MQEKPRSAIDVPTAYAETGGRRLAYRSLGQGVPLVLCLRFRGVMDVWDPAFLDALARHFNVITFDYSGLGQSGGEPSYNRESMARDALDLVDVLGFERVVIGGWSLGGVAAQIFAARYPERASHAVLIGTVPPGPQPYPAEDIFLPTALKPENTLEDEYILFFEPDSARSRAAADACHARIAGRVAGDRSPPIPLDTLVRILQESQDPEAVFADPDGQYGQALAKGPVPLLALCGDHDVVFPVENWYALNRQWKSLHIVTLPCAGHGPQHQEPEFCAETIASFVHNVTGS